MRVARVSLLVWLKECNIITHESAHLARRCIHAAVLARSCVCYGLSRK